MKFEIAINKKIEIELINYLILQINFQSDKKLFK